MRFLRPLALLTVLLVVLGACGGDDDIDSGSADGSTTTSTEPPAEEVTSSAPPAGTTDEVPAMFDFVADNVRGGEVLGAEYAGRDVVVWFWAPWCTKCNQEAPDMADLVAERGDEIAFLGMAGLADVGDMEAFVDRHGLSHFPHAVDPDGAIWSEFEVTSQSVFVFVNDDGSVRRTEYGVQGRDALDAAVDELLAT